MLFNLHSLNLLTIGGIVAAVVAGWQQIKSVYSYLQSFLIVSADLDYTLTVPVEIYLRKHAWVVPSGFLYFVGRYYVLKNKQNAIVPFRMTHRGSIFIYKNRIIFTGSNSVLLHMRSIRGTVDFYQLIKDALAYYELEMYKITENERSGRFGVIPVVGREKNNTVVIKEGDETKQERDTPNATASSDAYFEFNPIVDRSFMYPLEMYSFSDNYNPFRSLFFHPDIIKHVNRAKQWLQMREWYQERDIPWRLGWQLIGPPGSGKSSLIKATAEELGIPIYQFYTSTLSNQEFLYNYHHMQTPCVALLEEFDTVFHGREPMTEHKLLTFDCVINAISGADTKNGVFLTITANNPEFIDPAICNIEANGLASRPGRIDTIIKVGDINESNRVRMANKILQDWPEEIPAVVNYSKELTPAQFQELCVQVAYSRLAQRFNFNVVQGSRDEGNSSEADNRRDAA